MKKQFITTIFTLLTISLISQVVEKDLSMSEGVHNALTVELDGANKKRAEGIWKKYAKEYGKLERNKKAKEHVLLNAIIPAVDTEYPITVFTKFDEYDNMTRAYFWFKMDDHFLNSIDDEREVNGIDAFLDRYALEVEKEVVKEELKNEEKALKNLQKDLSKLEKKHKDLNKDIEEAKKKIADSEREIEKNLKEQMTKKEEISKQQTKVESVSRKMNDVGSN